MTTLFEKTNILNPSALIHYSRYTKRTVIHTITSCPQCLICTAVLERSTTGRGMNQIRGLASVPDSLLLFLNRCVHIS